MKRSRGHNISTGGRFRDISTREGPGSIILYTRRFRAQHFKEIASEVQEFLNPKEFRES